VFTPRTAAVALQTSALKSCNSVSATDLAQSQLSDLALLTTSFSNVHSFVRCFILPM
jgi:hypothetical protein